ncbi:MAG TPA: hypothetical protein VMY77_05580 [Chitinophagaceae bacterium]|nr:hypothetical protein [Chitinophagaceae bacterium]
METKTVSPRMFSLVVMYDMHTDFFLRALDGIPDKDAHNRLNTKANHMAWLAGSFVNERFAGAKTFGKDVEQETGELFKDHKGIQDNVSYPPLEDFKKDLERISPQLREALINVTDEKLDEKFEMMPGMQMTYYELITFMTYREASLIGQIALWRRLLGHEAMKYM